MLMGIFVCVQTDVSFLKVSFECSLESLFKEVGFNDH